MKNKELIYEYWGRTELGRKMIASNNVSESDLLFLIPNNVKRRLGLPLTRIVGKKKRQQKNERKRYIMSFRCFDIVEEMVNEILSEKFTNSKFIDGFVDITSLKL